MTHLEADFQERKRIVFTARERSLVNVRTESADGGPIGFNSHELLLTALANCTLGVVMQHQSLAELPVRSCKAVVDATAARAPNRIDRIDMQIELELEQATPRLQETLQRAADACPIGNTLRLPPVITINLVLKELDPASLPASSLPASSNEADGL